MLCLSYRGKIRCLSGTYPMAGWCVVPTYLPTGVGEIQLGASNALQRVFGGNRESEVKCIGVKLNSI